MAVPLLPLAHQYVRTGQVAALAGGADERVEARLPRAVIQQGYRVLYREAHTLLEELADATIDGTRKAYLGDLAAAPLLIIDDLGMRKLPHTADGARKTTLTHRGRPFGVSFHVHRSLDVTGRGAARASLLIKPPLELAAILAAYCSASGACHFIRWPRALTSRSISPTRSMPRVCVLSQLAQPRQSRCRAQKLRMMVSRACAVRSALCPVLGHMPTSFISLTIDWINGC